MVIECWLVKILVKNASYLWEQISEPSCQILLIRKNAEQTPVGEEGGKVVYAMHGSTDNLMTVDP